jgi:hypothetical protein
MVNVTFEELIEIINKIMKYAFDVMSSDKNWGTRRNELLEQQNIPSSDQYVAFFYTFQEICELNHEGYMNVGLIMVLVREIT